MWLLCCAVRAELRVETLASVLGVQVWQYHRISRRESSGWVCTVRLKFLCWVVSASLKHGLAAGCIPHRVQLHPGLCADRQAKAQLQHLRTFSTSFCGFVMACAIHVELQ
jgi:hypothetical protein